MVRNSTIVICGSVFIGVMLVFLTFITERAILLGVAFMVFFAGFGLASGIYGRERRIDRRIKEEDKKDD